MESFGAGRTGEAALCVDNGWTVCRADRTAAGIDCGSVTCCVFDVGDVVGVRGAGGCSATGAVELDGGVPDVSVEAPANGDRALAGTK